MNVLPPFMDQILADSDNEEDQGLTLTESQIKSIEKLAMNVITSYAKDEKTWEEKIEPVLTDGKVTKADTKKLMGWGGKAEKNANKAAQAADGLGELLGSLDEGKYADLIGKIEQVIDTADKYEELLTTATEHVSNKQ